MERIFSKTGALECTCLFKSEPSFLACEFALTRGSESIRVESVPEQAWVVRTYLRVLRRTGIARAVLVRTWAWACMWVCTWACPWACTHTVGSVCSRFRSQRWSGSSGLWLDVQVLHSKGIVVVEVDEPVLDLRFYDGLPRGPLRWGLCRVVGLVQTGQ